VPRARSRVYTDATVEPSAPITALLHLAGEGDPSAQAQVFRALYEELRRLAAAQRHRMQPGETLNTTALVHEAYIRLVGRLDLDWNDRHHFFCTAARSMRDILVDEARRGAAAKRGGGRYRVDLEGLECAVEFDPDDLLALDEALTKLEREDATDHRIVMLRYFAGLTIPEVAELLGLSLRSVERRWRFCRSWLARELKGEAEP
jgi:RNA polymerase sigma factor (TIGR02999 family)